MGSGSEFNDPKVPNCIIIVSDPTDEHCMEKLEDIYNRMMEKLEMNTCSHDLLENCEIIVVASKLDLLESKNFGAENEIEFQIREFAAANDLKFMEWSYRDRK